MQRHVFFSNHTSPIPHLLYRASDLPTTSGVNAWVNAGSLGLAYDLTVEANCVAPARYATAGPTGGPAVRFAGGDVLCTRATMPFAGYDPRLLLMRVFIPAGSAGVLRNFFGTGAPSNGRLADCTLREDDTLIMHQYYGNTFRIAAQRGVWTVVGYEFTPEVSSSDPFNAYGICGQTISPPNASGVYQVANPATPLRVGGGFYPPWNAGLDFYCDEMRVYNQFISPAQRQQILTDMLTF